jgi:uncharacterized protein
MPRRARSDRQLERPPPKRRLRRLAALASTFVTSAVGVVSFAVLQLSASDAIAPDWSLGIACGFSGLCGGYLGASLQPGLPEQLLRTLLGLLAIGLALVYVLQAAT